MNLNQLYYLQAIAQARGLTRAADALYVTQSNLSHSMAALEEELGIPLLYKNGRDTLLTPYGQEFLAYAERAIQEIEEGKRVAQSRCSPTRGQVRLGFISAVSATLIPWCVSHFYQNPDNQGITFTFDEKPTRRIAADFTHHALDIGFGTRFDDSSFEFCPVVPEELVAVVPAGHPLAQQEQVTLEQLSRERLVIYNQASPTRNLVLSMFRQQNLQPDVAFEVATDHMLASFVSQGLGVGIMPRMFGLRLYSVRPLYIADTETHRMLYMFRPKDRRVLPRSSGSGTLCWRSAPSTSLTNRYGKARPPRIRGGGRALFCPAGSLVRVQAGPACLGHGPQPLQVLRLQGKVQRQVLAHPSSVG